MLKSQCLLSLVVSALCLGGTARAAIVSTGPSIVSAHSVDTYTTFGSGDVTFRLTTNGLSQCDGFWLRATDPGFKTNVAALLATVASQGSISVSADDAQIWTGSAGHYCLVWNLEL
jgi:hypothetical protein